MAEKQPKPFMRDGAKGFTWKDYLTMGAISKASGIGGRGINPNELVEERVGGEEETVEQGKKKEA